MRSVADYKKNTGSSGTMMIRDTGSTVEFWINSNNSSTFVNELPWGYTINGSTNDNRESKYSAGAGWVKFGSWTVTTDQTVTFRIFDTGTSGFGGPTTLSAAISRADPPAAPSIAPTVISSTQINIKITDGANNGAAITGRQIAVNTVNTTSSANLTAVDTQTTKAIFPLNPGTLYYFWARTENSKGFSPWSPVKSATTFRTGDAPNQPIVSDADQTSFWVSFTDNGSGGTTILERQVGYSLIADIISGGVTWLPYTGIRQITGLTPGTTYYVYARVRNSVGWSFPSPAAVIRTIAGARIAVAGVYKEAVPYVKVAGTWKLARPWGRTAGVWKETT
jgi:hypothetical protein